MNIPEVKVHRFRNKAKKGCYHWARERDEYREWIAVYSDPHKEFEIARFYCSGVSCGMLESEALADMIIQYLYDKLYL